VGEKIDLDENKTKPDYNHSKEEAADRDDRENDKVVAHSTTT